MSRQSFELRLEPSCQKVYQLLVAAIELETLSDPQLSFAEGRFDIALDEGADVPSEPIGLGSWMISVFHSSLELLSALDQSLKTIAPTLKSQLICLEMQGWQQAWQDQQGRRRIGFFEIQILEDPESIQPELQTDDSSGSSEILPIILSQGTSFGDGRHLSTQVMLMLISQYRSLFAGAACLDIGCGNGVLTIAALRLGASSVVATDLDEAILREAQDHLGLNGFGGAEQFDLRCQDSVPQGAGMGFDLVLVNILGHELRRLLPEIFVALKPGGHLMISGFMQQNSQEILHKAQDLGLEQTQQVTLHGWMAVCLEVPKTS